MASKYSTSSGRLSTAKEKAIKRVNERRAQIQRDVRAGKLPESSLEQYDAAIRAAAGDFLNRSGNIAHGKAAQEGISWNDINALLQRESSRQLQSDIKKKAAEQYDKDPRKLTAEEVRQYVGDVDYVNKQFAEEYERTYKALDEKYRGVKGRKTYSQLATTIREWNIKHPKTEEVNPFNAEQVYFGR